VPLKRLDTSLIHFSTDSSFTPLTNYHFSTDSIQKKLTLQYNWKENTPYNLIIEKDFAQDTLGRELLKTDTLKFRTKKITDYGSIRIRFKNFDPSANPVLLFVQNDNVIKSFPLSAVELSQSIFPPGEYEIRILYDENNNGKWDPGSYSKKIQPEKVIALPKKISVRESWDNENDINL